MLNSRAPSGRLAKGVKMPEMKIRGNRIRAESIMTLDGTFPAGAEK